MNRCLNRAGLLASLILCAQIVYGQWTHFGLQGKTVTDMAANQTDGSVVAVADAKLYVTTNNGIDWLLLENGIEGLEVLSLAVDLDNTIYVGTSNGLHRSTDRGISFQPLNNQLPNDFGHYPAVGTVCVLNNLLFIGTSAGVYKTTKSSLQWQVFNNDLPDLDVNAMLVFLNDKIYLGMNTGVYRSSVREANWEQVYDKTIHDVMVVGNGLYAVGYTDPCHPVMRSSDFGDTWNFLGPGAPGGGGCEGSLAILSQGDGLWVATSAFGIIQFSLDKGTTWQNTQIPMTYYITGLVRRGTSLLAATYFYPNNSLDGGIFIRSNMFENIMETLHYPEFSTAPGDYSEPLQIEIESQETSARIFYTTDGTIPDASARIYQGPILANKTTLVNAISIDDTGARSRVNTGYYRIGSPLGVEDNYAALEDVFPNPCTDQIKLSLTEASDTNIEIIDALGRVVDQYIVTGKEATIDTHAFNPGLYYMVANSSGKRSYRRFVKV